MGNLLRQLEVKVCSLQARVKKLVWDEDKYWRGKTTPGSRGGSFAPRLPPFTKGPSGVLQRVITPQIREEVARAEQEKKWKVEAPWREKIVSPDWPAIQRLANRDGFGLGGQIEDIISTQHTKMKIGGKTVAAVRMTAYVSYPHPEGKGELGGRGLSDAVNFTLYRDPTRAHRLRFKGYW